MLSGCLQETQHKQELEDGTPKFPSAIPAELVTPQCTDDIVADVAPAAAAERPGGWASVSALGQEGTQGGALGRVVLASSFAELVSLAASSEPLIIQVCGLIEAPADARVELASHKTLIGVGIRPTLRVSVEVDDAQNVIIKNLFIEGASPDGVSVRRSHHVWIDHVDISDALDGNLDITNESDYVTVSFSRFWYSDPVRAHRFSNLIGSSDNAPLDAGKLRVTLHHNWWADNVIERMPRTRYGDIHVYNNYYTSLGNNYCIRSGRDARILVESNYFRRVSDPFEIEGSGQLLQRDNVFDASGGSKLETKSAFEPPYAYVADRAEDVPNIVESRSGVHWDASADETGDDGNDDSGLDE